MEIILLVVGALIILYIIGKLMGDPDPSSQGDEWLNRRLDSERTWVKRYLSLPTQQQASESLKRSYQRRSDYIKQIELEINLRKEQRTFRNELQSEIRVMAAAVPSIMKSENVSEGVAASIFIKKKEDAEIQARQEVLRREHDAAVRQKRFDEIIQHYQSQGFTEEQSSERACRQTEKEDAEKELQDALVMAESGNADAQFKLAEIFDARQNWEKSVSFYWKAASQGHKDSIRDLGRTRALHYDFLTDTQKKLLRVWKAEKGDQLCQVMLGEGYLRDGKFELAYSWFNKAASTRGKSAGAAQYYLAILHSEGKGVAKNDEMARDLFLKSAEQGYGPAQYRIGLLYQSGNGMPFDLDLAYIWLSMSITSHDLPNVPVDSRPSSSEAMNAFHSVAQSMSPSQIENAKSREEIMQRKIKGLP